ITEAGLLWRGSTIALSVGADPQGGPELG
uniref:3-methyladenine DNA glycosylase n=1 Tax=Globodera pallida TaxID=36090 RepID=A0A183CTF9_GLOPA